VSELLQNLVNGVVESCVYLLVALGITVVFGLTRLINFAHGQFLVIGAFLAYDLTSHGCPFWLAALVSCAAGGVLGLASERLLLRFTAARPLNGLIVSLGILVVLESAVQLYYGADSISVGAAVQGRAHIGQVSIPYDWLVILAVTVFATAISLGGLRFTSVGRQMRAARADSSAALHVGINVGLMITLAVTVASALAGLAGPLLGTLYPIGPYDGGTLILQGFAVALLGGLGSVPGAIAASVIYGMGDVFIAGYLNPTYVPFFTYGLIIVILLIRPAGFSRSVGGDDIYSDTGQGTRSKRDRPSLPERLGAKALLVAAPFLVWFLVSGGIQAYLTLAVLYAVQVYSMSFIYTQTGILSLAGSGLMAVGAYAGGLTAAHWGLNFWVTIPFAAAIGAVFAALLGYLVSRCRGHYMVLVTLAFGAVIYQITASWKSLTGGDDGLYIAGGIPKIGPIAFTSSFSVFVLALCLMFISMGVLWWVSTRTRLGLRLSTIRENEELAKSLGLRVASYKTLAFAIAGAVAAVGGLLFAYQQQFFGPASFSTLLNIQLAMMLVFGGRTLTGPVIGAAVVTLLPRMLGLGAIPTQIAVGAVLAAMILVLPRGAVWSVSEGYRAAREFLLARMSTHPSPGGQPGRRGGRMQPDEVTRVHLGADGERVVTTGPADE
jgi:branched-chain amino acid transport system permease protein